MTKKEVRQDLSRTTERQENQTLSLNSGELLVIPASERMLRFEIAERHLELFDLLGVEPPQSWPPPLNDRGSYTHFLDLLISGEAGNQWGLYYLIMVGTCQKLLGCGGFKGPPDEQGTVEIGYSVLPGHQRRGYGSRLVAMLCAKAFGTGEVKTLQAQTYVELIASIRVLEANGFSKATESSDGCVLFERKVGTAHQALHPPPVT